jgi:hypothetical protein
MYFCVVKCENDLAGHNLGTLKSNQKFHYLFMEKSDKAGDCFQQWHDNEHEMLHFYCCCVRIFELNELT